MIPKPFAFVLMPFSANFRDTYHLGIKPACEEAGYYCERLDEQIFEETMLERVYNQIAKADLLVADLSERNPNVFYETGYAHALGKRVILLTKNSDDIPFDLKHHFHIIYSSSIIDLKKFLKDRAAYYLTNPNSSSRNPFDLIAVLINRKAASLTADEIEIHPKYLSDDGTPYGLSVEVALHLLETAMEDNLEIDVRLITSNRFTRSEWTLTSGGGKQVYTVIPMPDGRLMHRPLNSVRLSSGDPDKVVFELIDSEIRQEQELTMVLRLIASGLRRDLPLRIKFPAVSARAER